jgi:ribosome-binding factor A
VKAPSRRPDQVAETVRQVLADAFLRGEVRDPRVGLVTVTHVEVTGDLSHARVRVAVPSGEDAAAGDNLLAGLQSAAGFLRSRVARALATRIVPELHFELDRGLEHASRIDALLAEIRRTESRERGEEEQADGEPEGGRGGEP